MLIHNKKLIGLIILFFGITIITYWSYLLYQHYQLAFTGTQTEATVTGYKMASSRSKRNNFFNALLKGDNPMFTFTTDKNEKMTTYALSFSSMNVSIYELNEKITIAYNKSDPKKAVVLGCKLWISHIFMLLFGFLALLVGKSYLRDSE